jgi:hypothetical protein
MSEDLTRTFQTLVLEKSREQGVTEVRCVQFVICEMISAFKNPYCAAGCFEKPSIVANPAVVGIKK